MNHLESQIHALGAMIVEATNREAHWRVQHIIMTQEAEFERSRANKAEADLSAALKVGPKKGRGDGG